MKRRSEKNQEQQGMNAEQIRALREKERMDSVHLEQPASKKALYTLVNFMTAIVTGGAVLAVLYYAGFLIGYLRSLILPFLYAIDNSSDFLTDLVTGVLHMLLFAVIAFLFGFALDINYARHGRPREVWGKIIGWILPAAFGSCLIYALTRYFATGGCYRVSGSILSQILYYFTAIVVVPAANVLLCLVLPSAVIRMLLTAVSDTKERTEIPLTLVSAFVMTFALLGITPNHIENYGAAIFIFTLIQSVCCSVLYHKTNVIRSAILLYSGVSALYLALAALLNAFS